MYGVRELKYMTTIPLEKKLDQLTPDRLFKWISVIASTATAVLLGSFLVYWLYFGNADISKAPADWGPFGDFIGGVTNPIISFFALLSLLLTLVVQSKQLEAAREEVDRTRKAAEEQMTHLRKEAKKADVFRTIEVLESRLEKLYREPIVILSDGQLEQWELYLLLSHAMPEVLKKVPALTDLGLPAHRNDYLRTKATLTQLHVTLVKLSMQLSFLAHIEDGDEISFFYEPTISFMAAKLKEIGYLPSPDDATIEINLALRNKLREARRAAASAN
jgi:hypothetical protein